MGPRNAANSKTVDSSCSKDPIQSTACVATARPDDGGLTTSGLSSVPAGMACRRAWSSRSSCTLSIPKRIMSLAAVSLVDVNVVRYQGRFEIHQQPVKLVASAVRRWIKMQYECTWTPPTAPAVVETARYDHQTK